MLRSATMDGLPLSLHRNTYILRHNILYLLGIFLSLGLAGLNKTIELELKVSLLSILRGNIGNININSQPRRCMDSVLPFQNCQKSQ